jgi:hypothetical protein
VAGLDPATGFVRLTGYPGSEAEGRPADVDVLYVLTRHLMGSAGCRAARSKSQSAELMSNGKQSGPRIGIEGNLSRASEQALSR